MAIEHARVPPVVVELTGPAGGILDWIEFRARFFPGHRSRHDFEALVAYGRYRRSGAVSHPAGERIPPVSAGAHRHAPVNGSNIAAPSTELSSWESEGGTALS